MLAILLYLFIWIIVVLMIWIVISIISILHIEEPEYTVVESHWKYEIRDYAPYIYAQVEVQWERELALWKWFSQLASYIFWENQTLKKNPNFQYTRKGAEVQSESIKMTAPIIDVHTGYWSHIIQFIMPRIYTIQNLPIPSDPEIKILENPMVRRAVIKYYWSTNSKIIEDKTQLLMSELKNKNLEISWEFYSAQYNPPMTFPLFKRNEIMVDIL
jgi:hypothetical protein